MAKASASDELHGAGLSSSLDGSNRPSHKQVEQYRRMKAKEYFEDLRDLLPASRDTRCDRNKILQEAIEYVKELQGLSNPRNRDDDDDDGLQFDMEDDSTKKEEDTRHLSHNQVEQRRRQLAKSHFEELRALLPDAGKFDKNTILLHTIQLIRRLTGKETSPGSSPSPTNECLSRSAPTSWASHASTEAAESPYAGLSGLSHVASSLSSASDLSEMLSSSCPEGRGRKRSPESVLFEETFERKRRVSDVLEEEDVRVKDEASTSPGYRTAEQAHEEMMAFKALTLLSECAERLSLESARNTPASTPKIAPQTHPVNGCALEAMSLTALCS
jgi:hypothetical protein